MHDPQSQRMQGLGKRRGASLCGFSHAAVLLIGRDQRRLIEMVSAAARVSLSEPYQVGVF
jgi:hypothetical protein